MCKGMKRIELIYAEFLGTDENGSAGSQGNVTSSVTNRSGSYSCCRVIARTCNDLHLIGQTEFRCQFRFQITDYLIALKDLSQLALLHITDLHHLFGPALMLYIEQKHTGCIGYIGTECTG